MRWYRRGTACARYGVPFVVLGHDAGRKAAFRFRLAGFTLLVVHLTVVGWLALRPLASTWVTARDPAPLSTIRADLALSPPQALRSIGGEMLFLAPLGVLLPWVGGRLTVHWLSSLASTVTGGAMVSLSTELLRSGVASQVGEIDSVLLNTLGVAVAHVAVVPAARGRLRRRRLRRHQATEVAEEDGTPGSAPTFSRVGVAP